MIDEKKIEEAAEKQLDDLGSYKLNEDELGRIGSFALYREEDVKEIFKAGINWFLDNLWHDASEEPKSNTTMATCLVKHKDGMQKVRFYDTEYKRWIDEYHCDISCWLYIDDLLKGGK